MRTREEIESRIAQCAKQRDYCANVLHKDTLAWTYQTEINDLVDELDKLASQSGDGNG